MGDVDLEGTVVTRQNVPEGWWSGDQSILIVSEKCVWNAPAKDIIMSPFILVFLVLVIFAGAYVYMMYRTNAERRAREKKRNQYHDRV